LESFEQYIDEKTDINIAVQCKKEIKRVFDQYTGVKQMSDFRSVSPLAATIHKFGFYFIFILFLLFFIFKRYYKIGSNEKKYDCIYFGATFTQRNVRSQNIVDRKSKKLFFFPDNFLKYKKKNVGD
jgi:hypothetical protein